MIIPKIEQAERDATNRERAGWEKLIFREADRAGVCRRGLSAGETLRKIVDYLMDARVER